VAAAKRCQKSQVSPFLRLKFRQSAKVRLTDKMPAICESLAHARSRRRYFRLMRASPIPMMLLVDFSRAPVKNFSAADRLINKFNARELNKKTPKQITARYYCGENENVHSISGAKIGFYRILILSGNSGL